MLVIVKKSARQIKVTGNRVAVIGLGRQGPSGVPGALPQLSDVSDATVATTAGHVLRANGSAWVNSAIQAGDLPTHQHSGADITSGTVAAARLGSGTPTSSTVLDGSGAWRAISNDDLPTGLSAGSGYGFTDIDAFALGTYGDGSPNAAKPGIACAGLASGGSIIYNCPSNKTHNFLVSGNLALLVGSGLGAASDTNWAIGRYGVAGANAAYNGIAGNSTSIYYNAGTGGGHSIRVGNTVVALVQSGGLTMSQPINLGNTSTLTAANNQVVGTASGARLQAATGSNAGLSVGGTDRLTVSATLATLSVPLVSPTATPASASAPGTAGQWAWDANYIYICVATNTWRRVAHATW